MPWEFRIPGRALLGSAPQTLNAGLHGHRTGKMLLGVAGNAQNRSPHSGVPGSSETVQAELPRSGSVAEGEASLGLFQCRKVSGPVHLYLLRCEDHRAGQRGFTPGS